MIKVPKNHKLNALISKEQELSKHERETREKYKEFKQKADDTYIIMQSAWERCEIAKKRMAQEFEKLQQTSHIFNEIWDEFEHVRERKGHQIKSLSKEASREHNKMQECYNLASYYNHQNNQSESTKWHFEGQKHATHRDELSADIKTLFQELYKARQNAILRTPQDDNSSYNRAREIYSSAIIRHESIKRRHNHLQSICDYYKSLYDSAQSEHRKILEELHQNQSKQPF